MHFTVPIALSPLTSFYPSFLYHLKRTTRRTEPSVLDSENDIWIMSNPCSFLHPNSESQFSSLQSLSCIPFFAIPWTAAYQTSLSITNSWSCLSSCPSSWWYHSTISSSVVPFFCLQSFPASGSFPWVGSSHQMVKVLKFQLQHRSFQ